MFDRNVAVLGLGMGGGSQTHTHNHRTDIHEHKAPTDESIMIYDEMLKKAQSTLCKQIKVDSTSISSTLSIFQECYGMTEEYQAIARYNLNGKDSEIRFSIPYCNTKRNEDLVAIMYEEISKHITRDLIQRSLSTNNNGIMDVLRDRARARNGVL